MPPVKSSEKLKPRAPIAPSATTISRKATLSDTQRMRMKSMLLSYGKRLNGFMWSCPSDGHGLELLAPAVDQRGDAARHRYRGIGGGRDSKHGGDAEPAQRPGTEGGH